MFEHYYNQQLSNLRKKAAEFSLSHPAIAPLLRENSVDPDVERLLEGNAFLNAILHEKLDDDLPELIRGIAEIIFPYMLRPLPSASIIAFTPKDSLLETITIPSGTLLSSIPVDGTRCQFRTTMNLDISPLEVTDIQNDKNSSNEEVYTVKLNLKNINLSQFNSSSLTFFAGGGYVDATQFFARIMSSLKRVIVTSSGHSFTLAPSQVSVPGFQSESLLFANKDQNFSRYSLLTEYFMFPEKFLFYQINGLNKLNSFGKVSDFEIQFILKPRKEPIPLKKDFFTLFAVPAVNLFPFDAEPVQVDNSTEHMMILPSCSKRQCYDIYTIDSITGFSQGTVERKTYKPYNKFSKSEDNSGYFQIHHTRSLSDNKHQVMVSLLYDSGRKPDREVLSIELTCTNAGLPSRLKTGDICVPTSSSPELATFRNITAPTAQIDVLLEKNELWRLLSHFSTNLLPLSDAESVKELLLMYTFHNQRSDTSVLNNLKRIDSIESFSTMPVERIIRGILMRGIYIKISFDETRFSSSGDAYLFCSVLDNFFSLYAPINTFIQFESQNLKTGENRVWQPRIGEKHLL